jgi:tetraacyldisaccharide 4'-kinase
MYGLIIVIRNWCYDVGIFRKVQVDIPVVSVGNLTAGGTSKTPFVEYLIRYYLKRNKKIAVLSRGYKRTTRGMNLVSDGKTLNGNAETMGDEPMQIAKKFPGVIVVVNEDRAWAARVVAENYNPDVILLDDGFQHRGIVRDLDIVMINGRQVLSNMRMLPAGLRREPLSSLQRADFLIISRDARSVSVADPVLQKYSGKPMAFMQFKPKGLYEFLTREKIFLPSDERKKCVAFCGIGNPASFTETLGELGFIVQETITFPDHHRYRITDLQKIQRIFEERKAEYIVTTEKDAIRLVSTSMPVTFPFNALCFVEVEVVVTEGERQLHTILSQTIKQAA